MTDAAPRNGKPWPPICFVTGTQIATCKGTRPIESLRPGDKVITRDNGIQEVAWAGHREFTATQLDHHEDLRPIRIKAGALGNNTPETDILVSPNHRMLITDMKSNLLFGEPEMLVAAKFLVNGKTIRREPQLFVHYVHLLFDTHELVFAEGAVSESFFPAGAVGAIIDPAEAALFEDLNATASIEMELVRPELRGYEAALLVA